MKREIKFRAWSFSLKEMLPNIQNHIGNDGWAFGQLLKDERFIIMQFTGLHDKNGKEIYEGDVVNRIDILNPHIKRPLQVIYKDGAFNVHKYYCVDDEENGYAKWFRLEIIGNIYENPELLNP